MRVSFAAVAFALLVTRPLPAAEGPQLPGTQPLTLAGDIASQLVDGVDRFLLREIETSQAAGESLWRRDFSSPEAYRNSIAAQRARLARFLGLRDSRPKFAGFERLDTVRNAGPAARSETYEIFPIRWRAFGDVYARGLLLKPTSDPPKAFVVALPDADVSPEQLVGLAPGVPEASQYARRLAEAGCYVVVPTLIDRMPGDRRCPHGDRKVVLTTREFLYRSAFELGRHPLGYELQMVFGALDGFDDEAASQSLTVPYGVFGWGEGGLVAMYAAALDERIAATVVSGAFDDRREMWKAPLDRNVFGLLTQFGDADTASMILPRALIVEAAVGPQVVVAPGGAGGPGSLATPPVERVRSEFARLQKLGSKLGREGNPLLVESDNGAGPYASEATRHAFAKALGIGGPIASKPDEIEVLRSDLDVDVRRKELTHEIVRHHELLLRESPYVRQEFMKRLNTSSIPAYNESARPYRDYFYNEVMGRFSHSLLPPNPRSRIAFESETCIAYEVTLDVFPDVIAYGVLLTPKGLKTDERRPVVVCQHGLEGRPMDVIAGDHYAYHDYATKLAERGFVVFAPQNLYLFRDRFRTL
ncbi:MAG TPA: hypothetical protein VGE52_08195, partial [Pirellulales bacterium]